MTTEQLTAAALALPPAEKAKLADQLLDSLHSSTPPDVMTAWAEEAERRIDAIDRGEMEMIPAEQAFKEAREHIGE